MPLKSEGSAIATILRDNKVHFGGSSSGRGLRRAARYYIRKQADARGKLAASMGAVDMLEPGAEFKFEDPFYVVDIGVVIAQLAAWKEHLPRVQPFYAVKCNPDPVIVKTLATLGASFDCASRGEILLVRELTKDFEKPVEIIYANPCKAREHILDALVNGVKMTTYDNEEEVAKIAAISKQMQLVLRIVTDDSGSQCRLSSKFGAPRDRWVSLLQAAKRHGMQVVGVSFHVGSGCRDARKYDLALKDARELFDLAEKKFGFKMTVLDIGGGFPGDAYSLWKPEEVDEEEDKIEDEEASSSEEEESEVEAAPEGDEERPFMYFSEIADRVTPMLDELFPADSGVRIIGEPGRFFAASAASIVTSVIACRANFNKDETAFEYDDAAYTKAMEEMPSDDESEQGMASSEQPVIDSIVRSLQDYSAMYANQAYEQQEFDTIADSEDVRDYPSARPRSESANNETRGTVEGLPVGIVADAYEDEGADAQADHHQGGAVMTLAAAGEAAVAAIVKQAIADEGPLHDDYSYYINDGVYGAFNNIMFDHASTRPRVLKFYQNKGRKVSLSKSTDGFLQLDDDSGGDSGNDSEARKLYASTIFGPTCDSIDVVCRAVVLPKLKIGDRLYFQNMGAYTSAAASPFNGFALTPKFYVCSVLPESLKHLR